MNGTTQEEEAMMGVTTQDEERAMTAEPAHKEGTINGTPTLVTVVSNGAKNYLRFADFLTLNYTLNRISITGIIFF